MKALKITGIAFLIGFGFLAHAQQLPLISNYYVNPFLSNPALAGSKGGNIFLLNRSPWNGSETNPETFIGSADGISTNGHTGYGISVFNDKVNILNKSGAFGTYSYKIKSTNTGIFSLGFSLGMEQSKVITERIKEEIAVEIGLPKNVSHTTNLEGNLGAAYQLKGLTIGIAGFGVFNNSNTQIKQNYEDKYNYRYGRYLVGTATYRINIIPNTFYLDPLLQIRTMKGSTPQTALSVIGNYKNILWAGAGYRQHYGVDFLAGILLANRLSIGYSYGLSTGNQMYNTPTAHEIIVGLKFLKNKSNLDTDKDGVVDFYDREPNTLAGSKVDKEGIAIDEDKDRVPDTFDKQINTPFGAPVDKDGVALDTDMDGVINMYDLEPNTIANCLVDKFGIAIDSDKDGVPDCVDKELFSHWAATVDANGVSIDTDNDKVSDVLDQEKETPHWKHMEGSPNMDASKCVVDANGITKDSDGDGVPDCVDAELFTVKGAKVNKKGVNLKKQEDILPEKSKDSDGDGIADELDLEPNTPSTLSVDQWGRSPLVNIDPASIHRIEVEEVEDNSTEWDYFVIIGVFRYYNNLKNYQKYLLKSYDEPTQVLVTEQNYFYAWTKKITTKDEAKGEVTRLSQARLKDYIVGNPWMWREPKKK